MIPTFTKTRNSYAGQYAAWQSYFLNNNRQFQIAAKKILAGFIFLLLFSIRPTNLFAQQKLFNKIQISGADPQSTGGILGITQDRQGFIWFITKVKGLYRYDGSQFISYTHTADSNSISSEPLESIAIDSNNIIWIGTLGGGLDRFDPGTNKFTHFRHNPNDPGSLAHDTVAAILIDHENNVWAGTYRGLDKYDRETGKFIHHTYKKNDPGSISSNLVRAIYEDRQGTIWAGCGSPFLSDGNSLNDGGLNRLNRTTGKFTRYLHDPNNPNSISNNKVRAILEDSKGNFWVGTAGDGLQTLNRRTGVFTHYYYDSTHPQNLSRGPLYKASNFDHITFIKEDVQGNIWIGTYLEGINKYDPGIKKLTHYGAIVQNRQMVSTDTLSGFVDFPGQAWCALNAEDGMLWICTIGGNLYNINPFKKVILPFTNMHRPSANSFYKDNKGALWIATDDGLVYKPAQGEEKVFFHDPHNFNSLASNGVDVIRADESGNLWIGLYSGSQNTTAGGLDKLDPVTHIFTHYRHNDKDTNSLSDNNIYDIFISPDNTLWLATNFGLDKMNALTGAIIRYRHKSQDSNSLSNNSVLKVLEEKNNLWAGTPYGLSRLNEKTGKWNHYLNFSAITGLYKDAAGTLWTGTTDGLYHYNASADKFELYENINVKIGNVLNIIEDNQQNLWVSTATEIFKIDKERKNVRIYGTANGVHANTFLFSDNLKTKDGQLFLGDQSGYYQFFPQDIKDDDYPPKINITGFEIGGKEIASGEGSILSEPLYLTNEITLAHDQNSFAVSFSAIHFRTPGTEKYLYMMENYDNTWHHANAEQKAYFFGLPHGHYILKIRAINPDGVYADKEISIIVSPPWWVTWWAIMLFALLMAAIVWAIIYYRSRQLVRENKRLEGKVSRRTIQLQKSLENLKSTQAQLIQSEKMASLGELTAGIAHEIQNPLNFVNNFSEINKEMLEELNAERQKPIAERDDQLESAILKDIKDNEEKILHHGKRADAIVKGMLQHSRTSSGQKEFTDINALADEYLRLSYHGLRAKDKSFNATMKTDFDLSIGKINVIPQDIGRVLLNLYNNAFYAVQQKQKLLTKDLPGFENPAGLDAYEPTVSVSTKKSENSVLITVSDNGNGIPQKVIDKIFQPFFTTKPTGEGTGLGLSLAYDIVKAHGGELKVDTGENKFTEFIIQLPII